MQSFEPCAGVLCCAVPVVGRWEEAKERLLILLEMLAYIPVQVQPLAPLWRFRHGKMRRDANITVG